MPTNASTAGRRPVRRPRQGHGRDRPVEQRPVVGILATVQPRERHRHDHDADAGRDDRDRLFGIVRGGEGCRDRAGHLQPEHVVAGHDDDLADEVGEVEFVGRHEMRVHCGHDDRHLVVEGDDVEPVLIDRQAHERGVELIVEQRRPLVGHRIVRSSSSTSGRRSCHASIHLPGVAPGIAPSTNGPSIVGR